jgi:hypothetical protein
MVDVVECVTGNICEAVLCPEGELCPNQKFCVNITAKTGPRRIYGTRRTTGWKLRLKGNEYGESRS